MRRISTPIATVALLVAAAGSVAAQTGPEPVGPDVYRVRALDPGDTLALRAEPSAASDRLGWLEPGEGPIEIVETRRVGAHDWALVSLTGGSAWVAKRFLEPTEWPRLEGAGLPIDLVCAGTEPFWSLRLLDDARLGWATPEYPEEDVLALETAAAPAPGEAALTAASATWRLTMHVRAETCSDGMSDRSYTRSVLVELAPADGAGARSRLAGCCGLPSVR